MARKRKPSKKNKKNTSISSAKNKAIAFLNNNAPRSYSPKQISRKLNFRNNHQRALLSDALHALENEGRVEYLKDGSFKAAEGSGSPRHHTKMTGTFDHVNPRFGFITSPDLDEDVKVSSDHMMHAFDGDTVEFEIFKSGRRGNRAEARITKIVERKTDEFVGRVDIQGTYAFVIADKRRIHDDIFVAGKHLKDAEQDQKVIVKIEEWPDKDKNAVGVVTKILGDAGENEVEMHSILLEFGLPYEFEDHIIRAAEKIEEGFTKEEIAKRRDFRKVTTVTIDPFDAKDFDDALSIRKLKPKDGKDIWEVGVHIADVTYYVRPDTIVEEEAYRRATSVYLVDRTVPMLPERLSNVLCSLRPHEDKFTYSAVFEMEESGKIHNQWFGRTIIHSDRRFTYEEAQEIIETGEGDFNEDVLQLNKIAKNLSSYRFKNGSVRFESREVKFKLDENAAPIELITKERKDAHKLIEEFMLLANKRVAEFIFHKQKNPELTFVYRIHADPDPDKLFNFANFASTMGYRVDFNKGGLASSLNSMVDQIEGKPEERVLTDLAIRSMAKAKYSTNNIGHFGLAFPFYSHFTSPIRRYPDVMVHRLLEHYLHGGKSEDADEYEEMCVHSSMREKLASEAERASIKYKQVEFMHKSIGQEFEGVVTGVAEYGLFVEIIETACEGMVRLSEMKDDYYEADPENYRVVGKHERRIIRFGDVVKVRVKDCNIMARTMDLDMVAFGEDLEE